MKRRFGARGTPRMAVTATATAVGVLGAALAWSTPASADDSAHEKAVAAFQDGRKYIEQGNCDAAITKLRDSLSYEPSVGARLSLAECYEKTDPLAAWRVLREAANLAYVNHDERQHLAEKQAAALEKRLPTLRINVPPATLVEPGFELRIDGDIVDKFDYRAGVIATRPGKHVVEASAPQRHWTGQVVAEIGGTTQVNVVLERDRCATPASATGGAGGAAAAPAAPITLTRESPGSTRRTLGLTLAGVGIVGLASGVVFGIVTLNKKSKIEDLCGGSAGQCSAPPGSVDAERESASTSATISTVSFIAGGVALVGGGLLYFTAPDPSTAASRAARTTASVRLAPRASTTGGTMGLEGTW